MENRKIKYAGLIIGTTGVVYLSFKFILPLFVPFIIAYLIVKLIYPGVNFIWEKIKIPKMITGSVLLILFLSTLFFSIFCICKNIIIQARNLIQNLPVYQEYLSGRINILCKGCDKMFGWKSGCTRELVDSNLESMLEYLKKNIMPDMTQQTVRFAVIFVGIAGVIIIVFVASFLIMKDKDNIQKKYEKSIFYKDIHKITGKLSETGIAYFKAQIIIMLITAGVTSTGLFLIKNKYALLIAIAIAVFDAFPVLGSGLIFIPWSIIMLMSRNFTEAAILITTYLICQIVRQILEPKLVGDRVGLKPVFSLMAMYVGVQLFGICGFFLGPFGLIIIESVRKSYKSNWDN